MDPDQKFERRRDLIIAIPTGFLAAMLVFVAIGCIQAAKDDAKWLLPLLIVFPLMVIASRISATRLRSALNVDEAPPPPENPGDADDAG